PPESLLEASKPAPPIGDVPSLKKLRNSLMGTRFELLKISTFAAFLLGFVGVSIHGSHLNNPDNAFVANTSAAFRGVTTAMTDRAAALRDRTEAVALAMVHRVSGSAANSNVMMAKADSHSHTALSRHQEEAVQVASLEPQHRTRHAHHHQAGVEVASADLASNVQWSGNLTDLAGFVTAKSTEAGHKLVDAVQGGLDMKRMPHVRSKAQHVAESFGSHFDVTHASSLSVSNPSSIIDGLFTPDSIFVAMAALMLYMIFVVVLVQIRGGLRSLGGNQAAA
ncbi:MAG TPA: hypothetical protein VKR29_03395, partial [Candidatus Binataceae bacterium]|nr:hypothetical protein [Candidatus Binataceae bacterium]